MVGRVNPQVLDPASSERVAHHVQREEPAGRELERLFLLEVGVGEAASDEEHA